MERPLSGRTHRPRCLFLRARPEWAELLPHLKQIGIEAVPQESLPRWDRTFGDLQAQVEQALAARGDTGPMEPLPSREAPARRKATARGRRPSREQAEAAGPGTVRGYTLDVFLPRKRFSKSFLKNKSGVSRVIEVRGDQTLEDLHDAIFAAFDREEEHLYEFQLGRGPGDRLGPICDDHQAGKTTIDSLGLGVGSRFGYLFDFGDCWQHQINVEAVEEKVPEGTYPRVTRKAGKSPPQYPDEDE
jgi:hypothetical protein